MNSSFVTRAIAVAALWGLCHVRYNNAPEAFLNPGRAHGMFRMDYLSSNPSTETSFIKQHPNNAYSLKQHEMVRVRPLLNQFDSLNKTNKAPNEYRLYYLGNDEQPDYKLTFAPKKLRALQHYTDSLNTLYGSGKPINLQISFEDTEGDIRDNFAQAWASDPSITLTTGLLNSRTEPETKSIIGHELAHIMLKHHHTGRSRANIREEYEADALGVQMTRDLDARIRDLGKNDRDNGSRILGSRILLYCFVSELQEICGLRTHPTNIRRAQYLQRVFQKPQAR